MPLWLLALSVLDITVALCVTCPIEISDNCFSWREHIDFSVACSVVWLLCVVLFTFLPTHRFLVEDIYSTLVFEWTKAHAVYYLATRSFAVVIVFIYLVGVHSFFGHYLSYRLTSISVSIFSESLSLFVFTLRGWAGIFCCCCVYFFILCISFTEWKCDCKIIYFHGEAEIEYISIYYIYITGVALCSVQIRGCRL